MMGVTFSSHIVRHLIFSQNQQEIRIDGCLLIGVIFFNCCLLCFLWSAYWGFRGRGPGFGNGKVSNPGQTFSCPTNSKTNFSFTFSGLGYSNSEVKTRPSWPC